MKETDDIEIIPSHEIFSDHVAARAEAFGNLVLVAEELKEEKTKELCLQMLRQLIRSIKTPPDAELTSIPGGKA
jgi:hypothetical protein